MDTTSHQGIGGELSHQNAHTFNTLNYNQSMRNNLEGNLGKSNDQIYSFNQRQSLVSTSSPLKDNQQQSPQTAKSYQNHHITLPQTSSVLGSGGAGQNASQLSSADSTPITNPRVHRTLHKLTNSNNPQGIQSQHQYKRPRTNSPFPIATVPNNPGNASVHHQMRSGSSGNYANFHIQPLSMLNQEPQQRVNTSGVNFGGSYGNNYHIDDQFPIAQFQSSFIVNNHSIGNQRESVLDSRHNQSFQNDIHSLFTPPLQLKRIEASVNNSMINSSTNQNAKIFFQRGAETTANQRHMYVPSTAQGNMGLNQNSFDGFIDPINLNQSTIDGPSYFEGTGEFSPPPAVNNMLDYSHSLQNGAMQKTNGKFLPLRAVDVGERLKAKQFNSIKPQTSLSKKMNNAKNAGFLSGQPQNSHQIRTASKGNRMPSLVPVSNQEDSFIPSRNIVASNDQMQHSKFNTSILYDQSSLLNDSISLNDSPEPVGGSYFQRKISKLQPIIQQVSNLQIKPYNRQHF